MRIDFANERVLAVVAHPDDAELLCAGTLWRARQDGAAVGICIMCRGDKGQPPRKVVNLAAVRRREAKAAAKLLDAALFTLGIADSELSDTFAVRRKVVQVYRTFRPTLVLAHALNDYHADHRAAGALAEVATWACTSMGIATAAERLDQPPALWWMDTIGMHDFTPGFYVDVTGAAELKRQMLAAHKSQISRGADGAFIPLEAAMLSQCRARGRQAGVEAAEAFAIHHALKRVGAW